FHPFHLPADLADRFKLSDDKSYVMIVYSDDSVFIDLQNHIIIVVVSDFVMQVVIPVGKTHFNQFLLFFFSHCGLFLFIKIIFRNLIIKFVKSTTIMMLIAISV